MTSTVGSRGPGKEGEVKTQPVRSARPNYNALHAQPLPLKVYPLPPLIPHNPLSILQISYVYLSQLVLRPTSHAPTNYRGYFSPETHSVHVTDEKAIRAYWESGFFGKGSLSRSEPSWLDREKRRRGLVVGETSEDVTKRRREERKEFKKERAKKEREVIEQKLLEEQKMGFSDTLAMTQKPETKAASIQSVKLNAASTTEGKPEPFSAQPILASVQTLKDDRHSGLGDSSQAVLDKFTQADLEIKNEEHLQLTLEEAFFLSYGLGVIDIYSQESSEIIPNDVLLSLARQHSYFPPQAVPDLQPDDPFLTSYVVYHHFRSLGWVVRPGIKFAVDWLLYNRGPVFSHAEFAVMILPSYRHPYWHENENRVAEVKKKQGRSWWWLHCVNRVQSQVRKSLVLVYVEIPPPKSSQGRGIDIGGLLKQYKVQEITLKRWIPNRSRD